MRECRLIALLTLALMASGCATIPGERTALASRDLRGSQPGSAQQAFAQAAPPGPTAAPPSGPSPFLAAILARGRSASTAGITPAPASVAPAAALVSTPTPVEPAPAAHPSGFLGVAARALGRDRPAPVPSVAAQPPAAVAAMAADRPLAVDPAGIGVPVPAEPAYTLDSGDRLRVVVFGQDGLSNSYFVDAGGNITLPLIGSVPARGQTTQELAHAVADRLRRGFIREPHVAIEVDAYRPFFILGEVTYPGQYPYVPNMTAETAVAIAGGFSPRAYRLEVLLDRPAPGGTVRSRSTVPLFTRVRPGDTVVIKERWF